MVKLEPVTDYGLRFIAENMRDEDLTEVIAAGHTPLESMMLGKRLSDFSVMVTCDGVPLTVLGLVRGDMLSGIGVPWLLSSSYALEHRREFLRLSPSVVAEMLNICPTLVNHVHCKNKLSIRWLRWLGFTIDEPVPNLVTGELFHRFHKEK